MANSDTSLPSLKTLLNGIGCGVVCIVLFVAAGPIGALAGVAITTGLVFTSAEVMFGVAHVVALPTLGPDVGVLHLVALELGLGTFLVTRLVEKPDELWVALWFGTIWFVLAAVALTVDANIVIPFGGTMVLAVASVFLLMASRYLEADRLEARRS